MVDVFLIVITIIIAVVLIGISLYVLALYCHPDDRGWGTSLFCKILVILGFSLCWGQILALPLDVGNQKGDTGGGLNMQVLWIIIYMAVLVTMCVLIPFAIFMYESDEDKTAGQRLCFALFQEFCTLVIVLLILLISWAFLNKANIPIKSCKPLTTAGQSTTDSTNFQAFSACTSQKLNYKVSFPIYCMAIMSFVGWFLFVIFGGVGLSALPIDFLLEFFYRPKLRSSKEAAQIRQKLKADSTTLIELGNQLKNEEVEVKNCQDGFWGKRSKKSSFNKKLREFKVKVFQMEKEHEIFKLELKYLEVNPLVFIFKLILGVIFAIVSIIWWIQILIGQVVKTKKGVPLSPFLNTMFINLENSGIGFISTSIFAFLAIYLLWCTQKGTFKVGVRIPLIVTIHPMKINETWMNSFLFNITLILISSVAIIQFCTYAFAEYTRNTDINLIFCSMVKYMKFYNWFYNHNVFQIAWLVWSMLVAIFLIIKPVDKPKGLKEIDALRSLKYKEK